VVTKPKATSDAPPEPPPADPPPDPGSGGAPPADDLDSRIRNAVGDRLKALGLDDDTGGDPPVSSNTPPPPPASTGSQESQRVEELVRAELAKVGAEKERDDRLAKVEKAIERPPVKQSRISAFLWGRVDA
jgi:hypothetical protein